MTNEIKLIISAIDETKAAFGQLTGSMKKLESDTGGIVKQIKEHWLGISAAIYAAVATIEKAWILAEKAAAFEEQKGSLNSLAATYRTTADSIIADIKKESSGLIGMADAVDVASTSIAKGLRPDQIRELAGAAETLSNVTGQKVAVEFRNLSEAIALGRERGLEMSVGIIDLNAKFGDQVAKMTDVEKAAARYEMVMAKVRDLHNALGGSTDTLADKMERLRIQYDDMQLFIGTIAVRIGAFFANIFNAFMATVNAMAVEVLRPIAFLEGLLNEIGLGTKMFADALAGRKAAMSDYAKSAVESLELMIASTEKLFNVQGKKGTGGLVPVKTADAPAIAAKESPLGVKPIMPGSPGSEAYEDWEALQMAAKFKKEKNDQDIKDSNEAAEKEKTDRINALETIKNYSSEYHLFRIQQLNELSEKMREAGIAEADTSRWVAEENKKAARESYEFQLQHADNFKDAFIAKFNLISIDVKSAYQSLADAMEGVVNKMKSHMESFFDYASDKFMKFGDLATSILHDIYMALVQSQIIEPIVNSAAKWANTLGKTDTSGGVALTVSRHQGGIIPRFHGGGLNSDERLAINKVGERYINKEQNEWLTNLSKTMGNNPAPQKITVKIENHSGVPLEGEQTGSSFDIDEHITTVVLKKMRTSPAYRNAMGAGGLI